MPVDFRDNFWGEGNNGFDALYRNMKNGYVTTKDLADFIKERSVIEETNSKLLSKLAKHASNCCTQGTFAPLWHILKSSTEKLATLHSQMVHRFQELVKEVIKYSEDQHRKHKQCKEEESGTSDIVQVIQQITVALQKAKESFNSRALEYEKLKRENASLKELERAEVKCRKACEDYKLYIDKYSSIRDEFEKKMTISCEHFQRMEEAHICQIKIFLSNYACVLQRSHALIGQVHDEFLQQCNDIDTEKLLEQIVNSRGTGTDRPSAICFEDADLSPLNQTHVPDLTENQTDEKISKKEGFLKSKRDKRKERKRKKLNDAKEDVSLASTDRESQGNPLNEQQIDAEGFTIKPQERHYNHSRDNFYSSSDDSDVDDDERKGRIHVEIKPVSNTAGISASIEQLRETIGTITLSPDPQRTISRTGGSTASTPDEAPLKRSVSMTNPLNKVDPDAFSLFSPSASSASTPTGALVEELSSPPNANSPNISSEINHNSIMKSNAEVPIEMELDVLSNGAQKSAENTITISTSNIGPNMPSALPRPASRRALENSRIGRMSPLPYNMTRTESVGSLTSDFKTTSMPVGSSRGPSPLTIGICDSIPLAVAFNEVVNACFRGTDETKCQVRLMGDMKVSFPAGIVQVLANNPYPAQLSFRITKANKLENIIPNKQLISVDPNQGTSEHIVYEFNMSSLTTLLRKQYEQTPTASYFNIDILKYHIKALPGAKSTPLHLVSYWKCEAHSTDLRIDYKYNPTALSALVPLTGTSIIVPVNGGVTDVQSKPKTTWNAETNRAIWKIPELSYCSEGGGLGSLRARFELCTGPTTPTALAAQFVCNGSSLSGADFELCGLGYRLSLIRKQVTAGKYLCESEHTGSSYS